MEIDMAWYLGSRRWVSLRTFFLLHFIALKLLKNRQKSVDGGKYNTSTP